MLTCLLLLGGVFSSGEALAQVPLPEMAGQASYANIILQFSIGGGPLALAVDAALAGSEPTEAIDTSTEIHWGNGFGETAKMTVGTVCPGQRFALSVEVQVTSFGDGTQVSPQPAVALTDGMMEADLLRDIVPAAPGREGYGTLVYRASATVADGTSADHGDDYHTITYTLLSQ